MQIYICINIEKVNKEVQGGLLYCMCLCVTCQEIKCLKHEWLQTPINNKYRIPSDFFFSFFSLFIFSIRFDMPFIFHLYARTYIWVCVCVFVCWKDSHCFVCAHLILFLLLVYSPLCSMHIYTLILLYVPKRINQSYLYIYEYPVLCTANKQYRNPKE